MILPRSLLALALALAFGYPVASAADVPSIEANGPDLLLSAPTGDVTFTTSGGSTDLSTLSATVANLEDTQDDLADLATKCGGNTAGVESLKKLVAAMVVRLDAADKEREAMAAQLKRLAAHADCGGDSFMDTATSTCKKCSSDAARFYSELVDACLPCSALHSRTLIGGKCVLANVCKATEFEVAAPTVNKDRVCKPVSAQCGAGTFQAAAPTATSDRTCTKFKVCGDAQFESVAPSLISDRACQALTVCKQGDVESIKPTAVTDRACAKLKTPTTCREVQSMGVGTASGVYKVYPPGVAPFDVYCDLTTGPGGWTLIGKIGTGSRVFPRPYEKMSDGDYEDLFLNAADDVNPSMLQDNLALFNNMAFYNEAKTNALGYASKNPVFMLDAQQLQYNNQGVYLQAPINPPKGWQAFRAIRDATYWGNAGKGNYVDGKPGHWGSVEGFGKTFRLAKGLHTLDAKTNAFTHSTCGDTTFGYWGRFKVAKAGKDVTYTKHLGFLQDGYCGRGGQWLMTAHPQMTGADTDDARFKNDNDGASLIYLR